MSEDKKETIKDLVEEVMEDKSVVTEGNLENTLNGIVNEVEEEKAEETENEITDILESFNGPKGTEEETEGETEEETEEDVIIYSCPNCDYESNEKWEKCPECGQEVQRWEV